jgi:carboxypeptidase T
MKYFHYLLLLSFCFITTVFSQPRQNRNLLIQLNDVKPESIAKDSILKKYFRRDPYPGPLENSVVFLSNMEEFKLLKAKGYNADILLQDTSRINLFKRMIYGENSKLSPAYHTYESINSEIDDLVKKYPRYVKKIKIGITTQDKRDIFAVKISDNVNKIQDKPGILLNGCHHSNELLGAEICMTALNYMIKGYGNIPEVTDWMNNYEIFIVPVVNVDGHYVVTHNINPSWRKNTRDLNKNGILDEADGIDLNRNYDYNFAFGGSSEDGSGRFRGEYPFSESENVAMKNLAEMKHFVFSITYHSQGEVIYYPWLWGTRKAPDDSLLTGIANGLARSIKTIKGDTCYKAEYGAGMVGQTYPWFYGRYGTFDFVIETSKGAQIVPERMIKRIVDENINGIRFIMDRAKGPGLTGHITDSKTGKPLQAVVWLPQIETEELNRRTSEPVFGRFWRLLLPKTYNLIISKEGYETQVIKDIIVKSGDWTTFDIRLKKK